MFFVICIGLKLFSSRFGCLEKITSGEADITNVDPNGLYLAGKFFNLKPIVTELVDGGMFKYFKTKNRFYFVMFKKTFYKTILKLADLLPVVDGNKKYLQQIWLLLATTRYGVSKFSILRS